jgi:hypothetical protein
LDRHFDRLYDGGFISELWGDDIFSYSSVLLGGGGGFIGLYIAYSTYNLEAFLPQ